MNKRITELFDHPRGLPPHKTSTIMYCEKTGAETFALQELTHIQLETIKQAVVKLKDYFLLYDPKYAEEIESLYTIFYAIDEEIRKPKNARP